MLSSTTLYLLAPGYHILSSRVKSAAQRKDVDRLLLLAQVLVGDLVSKFQLALLLSKMRVDRKDGLVNDCIGFPCPADYRMNEMN